MDRKKTSVLLKHLDSLAECASSRTSLLRSLWGKLEPTSDMFLVYLRVFAEKCGLLDFLKLFVFSLASRKPPGPGAPQDDNSEVTMERAFG